MKKLNVKYPPIYRKKELLLAFEFGLILAETAREKKIKLTSDISIRTEKILIQELRDKGFYNTTRNFVPLILAALEIKE